jgi:hypothetical protein
VFCQISSPLFLKNFNEDDNFTFLFFLGSKSKVASNASNQPLTLPVNAEPGVSFFFFKRKILEKSQGHF